MLKNDQKLIKFDHLLHYLLSLNNKDKENKAYKTSILVLVEEVEVFAGQ